MGMQPGTESTLAGLTDQAERGPYETTPAPEESYTLPLPPQNQGMPACRSLSSPDLRYPLNDYLHSHSAYPIKALREALKVTRTYTHWIPAFAGMTKAEAYDFHGSSSQLS
jgi:hypothetical protein